MRISPKETNAAGADPDAATQLAASVDVTGPTPGTWGQIKARPEVGLAWSAHVPVSKDESLAR